MSLALLIAETIARLDRAEVPYMITGSVASSFHGQPRSTRDLDIVIDPDRHGTERLIQELERGGLYVDRAVALGAFEVSTQFNAIDGAAGWKIDFMLRKDRPFSREEFRRRVRSDLLGTLAWIASPEDTILAKLEWAAATDSHRQLGDVAAMLDVGAGSLDLAYVDRWVTDLGLRATWDTMQALRS